jgi:hypothetical protein
VPSARVVIERPAPGLLRGKSAGPRWLLAAIAALALAVVATFYFRRFRRKRAP